MGLQYVLSIFGRTLSDRPLSSAWRMTGKPSPIRLGKGGRLTIHDARQGRNLPTALWMSFGDGVQPIHDRGLHCDPMIRKRMVGAYVLLGNLGIASLPQNFC